MNRARYLILFNAIGFNVAWWGCVYGVKWDRPWLGPLLMAVYLTIHFLTLGLGKREVIFVLAVGLIGTVVDSVKASTGLIGYEGGYGSVSWIAPLWITAMWAGFAALVHHSLGWLRGRVITAFLMGAVFGPLAYQTGVKFDVLSFDGGVMLSLVVLALVWGIAMPLLYVISDRMNVRSEHV